MAVAGPDARGHDALWFDRDDARQARQRMAGAADRGSTKVTVTSCRSATENCVVISASIASMKTKPTTRMAAAKPMPTIDAAARNGWRAMLRTTMRPALPSRRANPAASREAAPVTGGRLGAHRLGGWDARRRGGRLRTRRGRAAPEVIAVACEHDARGEPVQQDGKRKNSVVEPDDHLAEPDAGGDAQSTPRPAISSAHFT